MSEAATVREGGSARFVGLVDLASEQLGGRALGCSDDFFAEMQNMLKAEAPVFLADEYTDRGKWMDGWESRRKRTTGYDHCIIELGVPGQVVGFDIDTSHFLGNHPPYASVDGLLAPRGSTLSSLEERAWSELLPQAPLSPGSHNLFIAATREVFSHVRLNIFPDGGVARFRVYGHVAPDFARASLDEEAKGFLPSGTDATGWVDLAATTSGGMALACSDAFFGPTNNLILPGRAVNMGGGWETRRRRGAGADWVILRLGARGTPKLLEIDTNHFKGNFPDRCSLDVLDVLDVLDREAQRLTDLIASAAWVPALPEMKLKGHTRHFYHEALQVDGPVTHVRLNVIPDGGISRLRLWGVPDA